MPRLQAVLSPHIVAGMKAALTEDRQALRKNHIWVYELALMAAERCVRGLADGTPDPSIPTFDAWPETQRGYRSRVFAHLVAPVDCLKECVSDLSLTDGPSDIKVMMNSPDDPSAGLPTHLGKRVEQSLPSILYDPAARKDALAKAPVRYAPRFELTLQMRKLITGGEAKDIDPWAGLCGETFVRVRLRVVFRTDGQGAKIILLGEGLAQGSTRAAYSKCKAAKARISCFNAHLIAYIAIQVRLSVSLSRSLVSSSSRCSTSRRSSASPRPSSTSKSSTSTSSTSSGPTSASSRSSAPASPGVLPRLGHAHAMQGGRPALARVDRADDARDRRVARAAQLRQPVGLSGDRVCIAGTIGAVASVASGARVYSSEQQGTAGLRRTAA